MSTRPVHLEPPLTQAIERAREALDASGARGARRRSSAPALDETERAAIRRMLHDGTYRRLADEVARADAELADL